MRRASEARDPGASGERAMTRVCVLAALLALTALAWTLWSRPSASLADLAARTSVPRTDTFPAPHRAAFGVRPQSRPSLGLQALGYRIAWVTCPTPGSTLARHPAVAVHCQVAPAEGGPYLPPAPPLWYEVILSEGTASRLKRWRGFR